MTVKHYSIDEVAPLIDWSYFFHAWKMNAHAPREQLMADAQSLLQEWSACPPPCHAIVHTVSAHSDGDDIVIDFDSDFDLDSDFDSDSDFDLDSDSKTQKLPMLRQQTPPYLCLADFLHPVFDTVSLFATSISDTLPHLGDNDSYMCLLAQTTADRLAEATAERISQDNPGLRPAVGYPSMPDMSLAFLIDDMLQLSRIGISLTESGAMRPHASVCGLIINHPEARYFHVGAIGDDQRHDYANRRGFTYEQILKYLPL